MHVLKKKIRKYLPWFITLVAVLMLIPAQVSLRRVKNSLKQYQTDIQAIDRQLKQSMYLSEKANADDLFFEGRLDEASEIYLRLAPDSSLWKERFSTIGKKEMEQKSWESNMRLLNKQLERSLIELEEIKAEFNEESVWTASEMAQLRKQNDSLTKVVKNINADLSKARNASSRLSFSSKKNSTVQYIGEIKGGKANGKGFGFWTTGSMYEGQWKDNTRHGKGEFSWADGEKYKGEYVDDQREGFGIYLWKNGERYEGQWKDDRRNGEGTLYDNKGKVKFSGKWTNDEPAG